MSNPPTSALTWPQVVTLALGLALGAAISLGITRFAYGLLLPPMKADLAWSYTLAGGMNTANALGYLVGALTTPWLNRRWGTERLFVWGMVCATGLMALPGWPMPDVGLLVQRGLAGVFSAWVFVTGGLLAARLGMWWPQRSGLVLGLYYGGTGFGIVLSSLAVPWAMAWGGQGLAWPLAWWVMTALSGLALVGGFWAVKHMPPAPVLKAGTGTAGHGIDWQARLFWPTLLGYTCFGLGYIGYMTFVIALLREQGHGGSDITLFYALLGVMVMMSSRLWAGLLDKHKDGQPLARLNALLGLATLLPAVTQWWPVVVFSGLLFGSVFLSVVASTTAIVKHNVKPAQWATGVSAYTIVFAAGQMVGPAMVGWIADGPGGLSLGLMVSAAALWLGAVVALRQKAWQ